uniref:ATP synthase F0 subunit 8 n=1 Tax=Ditylenchus dipsaci TaxID=166011 RepID=A0A915D2Z0_9BILA
MCCSVYILQQDEIRGESLTTPFSSSTTNVEMDAATAAGMETPTKTRAQAGGELPSLTTFLLDFLAVFFGWQAHLLLFASFWVWLAMKRVGGQQPSNGAGSRNSSNKSMHSNSLMLAEKQEKRLNPL